MKLWKSIFICLIATMALTNTIQADSAKIGLVNFKECIEHSTLGKKEQESFENIKAQMEKVLTEKEKGLNELASKLQDEDYLDSLKPEAEAELKHQLRAQGQELNQAQQQYYQTLQQANFKILQKVAEEITKAAEKVAEEEDLDLVLNDDSVFFKSSKLDITKKVISEMNKSSDN